MLYDNARLPEALIRAGVGARRAATRRDRPADARFLRVGDRSKATCSSRSATTAGTAAAATGRALTSNRSRRRRWSTPELAASPPPATERRLAHRRARVRVVLRRATRSARCWCATADAATASRSGRSTAIWAPSRPSRTWSARDSRSPRRPRASRGEVTRWMIAEIDTLNDVQRDAVLHSDGPVLIFAGAGSGKTRVLTHRIAHLLQDKDVFPNRILAVTFTNRAAGEMKARLERMVGAAARATCGSGRSTRCACASCAATAQKIGIAPNFAIMDETDQRSIVKDVLHELDFDERQITPGAALNEISKAKNALLDPDQYESKATSFTGERYATVYRLYERRLRESNGLDFDDLISQTIRLLETRRRDAHALPEQVPLRPRRRVPGRQLRAVPARARCSPTSTRISRSSATTISRSTRGAAATTRTSCKFEHDFPGAKVFKLEENYRSTADDPDRRERAGPEQHRRGRRRRSSPNVPAGDTSRSTAPRPSAPKRAT